MFDRLRRALDRLLGAFLITLVVTLTAIVVVAVVYRKLGAALVWYDEVASIMLAWITYYGAALAALRRGHIGFEGLILKAPPMTRMAVAIAGETLVLAFFGLLAWTGWQVLVILEGETLVSLPGVPIQLTQSVIPIGAVLFMICHALSAPEYFRRLRRAGP